jgi:hypothetical protein
MKSHWIAAVPVIFSIVLFLYKFLMKSPNASDQGPVPANFNSKKFWIYISVMFVSSIAAFIAVYLLSRQ